MAALQAEIGEQAAEVHRNHKFSSGATEPTGESSPTKLASGLVGTAQVCTHMQAADLVCSMMRVQVRMHLYWPWNSCVVGLDASLCGLASEHRLAC